MVVKCIPEVIFPSAFMREEEDRAAADLNIVNLSPSLLGKRHKIGEREIGGGGGGGSETAAAEAWKPISNNERAKTTCVHCNFFLRYVFVLLR